MNILSQALEIAPEENRPAQELLASLGRSEFQQAAALFYNLDLTNTQIARQCGGAVADLVYWLQDDERIPHAPKIAQDVRLAILIKDLEAGGDKLEGEEVLKACNRGSPSLVEIAQNIIDSGFVARLQRESKKPLTIC